MNSIFFKKTVAVFASMIALCAVSAAQAQNAQSGQKPHPAIVRIIAPENNGVSFGSGSLVAVNETYGLVVTNWHVVRDATGVIYVAFPNGFYTAATLLKIDRDWDLAALAVWKPNVTPLLIATQAPQLGEYLTIAGYGSGTFRASTGQCTQYVSPGSNLPFEMLELSTSARNGDSGGPILNNRGEIAGVLFGSAFGRTTGSYCGRLRWFISSAYENLDRLPVPNSANTALAQQSQSPQNQSEQQPRPEQTSPMIPVSSIHAQSTPPASVACNERQNVLRNNPATTTANHRDNTAVTVSIATKPSTPSADSTPEKIDFFRFDQLRNFLAVFGLFAILVQGLRMVGKVTG